MTAIWFPTISGFTVPATPVGPFSPTNIANMFAWYDGQQAGAITYDADDSPAPFGVDVFADRSGNANDLEQSAWWQKPTYLASGINGHPCVQFAGGEQCLRFNSTALPLILKSVVGYSIFMVVYLDTGACQTGLSTSYSTADEPLVLSRQFMGIVNPNYYSTKFNIGLFPFPGGIGTRHAWNLTNSPENCVFDQVEGNYWSESSAYVVGTVANFTVGNVSTYRHDVAGALLSSSSATGITTDNTVANPPTGLGFEPGSNSSSVYPGSNDSAHYRLGELLIYNKAISATERANLVSYLRTKWGI